MPSLYQIKPAFQRMLYPVLKPLHAIGFTPNHITICTLAISLGFGACLMIWPHSSTVWYLLPVWLFARMALNAIDGMLAKTYQQASKLGAILNEAGDVAADVALYLPLALVPQVKLIPALVFVALAVISELIGLLGIRRACGRCFAGPMGKSDRAFLIGVIALSVASGSYQVALVLVVVGDLLLLVTIANRLRRVCGS